jgi:hypothetical protein
MLHVIFWGSHSSVDEDSDVLVCYAMSTRDTPEGLNPH